jgi:hypothetical protein
MPLTTGARDHIASAIIGAAVTAFNAANAYLGVGDGVTAFATSQTDLVGASKARKAMDATYPTAASGVITARSTFATTDANFAWNEVGFFNASTAGTMLVRWVQALGTKTSAMSSQLTATITLS